MSRYFIISFWFCVTFVACDYNSFDPIRDFDEDTLVVNTSIRALREYYDQGDEEGSVVADPIVIGGRVTTSDVAGNFFRTFFIEDATGALEVMAGVTELQAIYPLGQLVAIRMEGLAVSVQHEVLRIGLPPAPGDYYFVNYFAHRVVLDRYIVRSRHLAPVDPLPVVLGELDASLCGRLVRIDGLFRSDTIPGLTWAVGGESPRTGYRMFRDAAGDSLCVVTSGYSRLAATPLPEDTVSLTGILSYGPGESSRKCFQLKLRDQYDIEP